MTAGTARVVLVTGGARAGKSRWAESRLGELVPPPWRYLATAEARDDEMRERIAAHRARRGSEWQTIDAPHELAEALAGAPTAALVDCVTLWLTNRMLASGTENDDASLLDAVDELARAARAVGAPVVLVTNEVGGGIVPDHPLGRRFRDLAGWANQRLAAAADEVVLVSCGLPLRLK